jgi:hypothetical protein
MFCRWRSSYIEGIVGIPLTFVFICFADGDPFKKKGLLGSHQRLFIYVLPLEIQLYRRDCWYPINICLYIFCRWRSSYIEDGWDPINVCLHMFCRWRSSYIEGMVWIPLTFVYIYFAVGDPVI